MTAAFRLRLVLPALALITLAVLMLLTSLSFAKSMQRPVAYHYFDEALAQVPDFPSAVVWRSGPKLARAFGDVEENVVGRALTEAWALHAAALATQNTQILADRFSGVALARASASAEKPDTRMVVLHQEATPLAFHKDGSVLQVADKALTARFLLKDGALQEFRLTEDANVTTLLNEVSGWHIVSHERRAAVPVAAGAAQNQQISRLAGVNYYPAATPWRQFWPQFDLAIVQGDLALIHSLGANAVRIFLPRGEFLDPALAPANLENLRLFLRAAEKQGLQVVPTLFDLRGGYEPSLWADDFVELQNLLPVLAAAPNLAFVDLKNEADLDYETYGKGTVQAWLMAMAGSARILAPNLKLSIGWSQALAATEMTGLVDVVTYHDYLASDQTADRLAAVRRSAAGKPVMITEIGTSSWSALFNIPSSPTAQAEALASRGGALLLAEGMFVWTLHDFAKPDPAVFGHSPWQRSLQAHYGLFDAAGQEKPSAATIRNLFSTSLKGLQP